MFGRITRTAREVEGDVEMERLRSNPSNRRNFMQVSSEREEDVARRGERQRILQDGQPTFVPNFSVLRETCVRRTCDRLRMLDSRIRQSVEIPERDRLVDQAATLLQDLDRQFNAVADLHQLGDPDYAAERGLSLTHFTLDHGANKGDWMLLTSDWGFDSPSITETDSSKLTSIKKEWLKEFCGEVEPSVIAFKRRKTVLERQPGAVVEDGKILVPNPRMKAVWGFILALGFTALICFLGVGIIATTTTFSPIFTRLFFWIAIIWTLASSSLLVLLVRAFGAGERDCVSAFLAAVAIWLVVIQIGQTKLNGQLGVQT